MVSQPVTVMPAYAGHQPAVPAQQLMEYEASMETYVPLPEKRFDVTNHAQSIHLFINCPCMGYMTQTLLLDDQEATLKTKTWLSTHTTRRPYAQLGAVRGSTRGARARGVPALSLWEDCCVCPTARHASPKFPGSIAWLPIQRRSRVPVGWGACGERTGAPTSPEAAQSNCRMGLAGGGARSDNFIGRLRRVEDGGAA